MHSFEALAAQLGKGFFCLLILAQRIASSILIDRIGGYRRSTN
jgi:hypothetical protein